LNRISGALRGAQVALSPFISIVEGHYRDVLCPLFKVYSTSITMVLSGEGFREGLQPSLSPIVQIYAALKS